MMSWRLSVTLYIAVIAMFAIFLVASEKDINSELLKVVDEMNNQEHGTGSK